MFNIHTGLASQCNWLGHIVCQRLSVDLDIVTSRKVSQQEVAVAG